MIITPMMTSFVMHFGEMGSRWGINRTIGQIYALIVISKDPLHASQIMEALSISRGNVSMGIKELQSWQLIQVQHQPGDRKEYFSSSGSIWDMAKRIFEERRKREIDPTLSILRDKLLEDPSNPEDQFAQEKMQEMYELLELFTDWAADIQHMDQKEVRSLMQLGSRVGKVLDMKNRLIGHKSSQSDISKK